MPIPQFLQSALWSYDLKKMDSQDPKDRHVIIQHVLNCGTWDQLKWLLHTYSWQEIKEEMENPSRGSWDKKSLNYWVRFFNIQLSDEKYQRAIMNINPQF